MRIVSMALAFLFFSSVACAQDALGEAEAAYERGSSSQAQQRLEEALASGELRAEGLARAHRLLGILAVARRDDEASTRHFTYSLALDGNQTTPAELYREAVERYEALRATPSVRIDAGAGDIDAEGAHDVRVDVVAPSGLVTTIEVNSGASAASVPHRGEPISVPGSVAAGAQIDYRIQALDEHGNQVAATVLEVRRPQASDVETETVDPSAAVIDPEEVARQHHVPEPPPEAPPSRKPLRIALGVAIALVVVGAAVGVGVWAAGRDVPTQIEVRP